MSKKNIKSGTDIQNIIENAADIAAERVISEFKKQGLIKDNKTAFQKTETLLYNYNNFQRTISDRQEQIQELKKYGTKKKSKSITSFTTGGYFEDKCEDERIAEKIIQVERSIIITKNLIDIIERAMGQIKDDKYFEIIKLKYFENKTREDIAEYFDIDIKTVTRNKNKLINTLKITLFPDDSVEEMLS